jgi:LDH2 family malate/lactate/ureidoglycolate dehydrogenase
MLFTWQFMAGFKASMVWEVKEKDLKFKVAELSLFARSLLEAIGLDAVKSKAVSDILIEGDLLGHSTHGLALLAPYLAELASGKMTREGLPELVSDCPAAITWDGKRLPGPGLVLRAMDLAISRAKQQGTCTVVIKRSHHIACLAAYHQRATTQGMLMALHCSDPNTSSVAPFGGLDPVFTPNPVSFGIPSSKQPIIVDVSTSATTNGMTNRLFNEKKLLPAKWVMDGHGQASTDPAVLFAEPKGTILPLGGMDSGHKGYGLSLMVEAMTGGLAGHGRADPAEGWGATVFLQIIDPQAFAGLSAFERQLDHVVELCQHSKSAKQGEKVRLPGERGLQHQEDCQLNGLPLYDSIMPALMPWAEKFNIPVPQAA